MVDTEKQSGVNWDYLEVPLDSYKRLLYSYRNYNLATLGLGSKEVEKKKLVTAIKDFWLTILMGYNSYLFKHKDKLQFGKDDYKTLSPNVDDEKLHKMTFEIIEWSQSEGPFATLNEKRNPHEVW